jgi:hypothetical protein
MDNQLAMPAPKPSQDYLTHYFDIARYQWLFALSIGVFLTLFLLVFQPFGVNNFDPTFHISLEFALAAGSMGMKGTADVGPFAVTWYGILFILMIRAQRKMLVPVAA